MVESPRWDDSWSGPSHTLLPPEPDQGFHERIMTMLAFGLLDLFVSMLWFFLLVMWLVIVIRVFADILRSEDLGGFAKVFWMLFVMFLPLLGVFVYIVARGKGMSARDEQTLAKRNEAFDAYVRETDRSTRSMVDELGKLTQLRDSGAISAEDYEAAKAKLLA